MGKPIGSASTPQHTGPHIDVNIGISAKKLDVNASLTSIFQRPGAPCAFFHYPRKKDLQNIETIKAHKQKLKSEHKLSEDI